MGRVTSQPNIANLSTPEEIARFTSIAVNDLNTQINGNIEFGLNIKSSTVDVEFGAANTDVRAPHGLGRIPIGFLVAGLNVAATIYNGSQANDASFVYLRSSAPCTAKIIVI
jgi:hypothetical protein